jgi:RNA polymerase sigma-70 factor, ECF subfamily
MTDMDRAPHDTLQTLADPELVRLLVSGNQDAMTVIFDRYWRLVMSVALHILHDAGEAEDVAQIVFTEFYERAELFDPAKGNLRNWLLQYSYGRSFNQKRRLRSHGFFERVEVEEAERADGGTNPESASEVSIQDAAILVHEIMPHLTNKQRHVIEKAFFEGMKLSEVASQTGEPIGNVRHAYYRGIEKLRSVLVGEPLKKPSPAEPSAEVRETEKSSGTRMTWLRKSRPTSRPLTREVDVA